MRLIDADALEQRFLGICDMCEGKDSNMCRACAADDMKELLEYAPTIDAAPVVHGEWIDMTEDYITGGMWRCSVCEYDMYFDIMTPTECGCLYCPNCGAKLDGGVNNEQA